MLHDVPLLGQLPRVELAKLVSDVEEVVVHKGDSVWLSAGGRTFVYIITRGKIGAYIQVADTNLWLMTLGPGEVVGAGAVSTATEESETAFLAQEDAWLLRVDASRFEGIVSQNPAILRQLNLAVMQRSAIVLDELARVKKALFFHAQEIWESMELAESDLVGVAAAAQPARPAPHQAVEAATAQAKPNRWRGVAGALSGPLGKQYLPHIIPVLAGLLAYSVGGTQWQFSPVRGALGVLIWGVFAWLFDAIPDYVVAVGITLMVTLAGIVTPEVAFSGFSSKTWFLLLAVLGISAGISRTGLLYRVALHMLKLFPSTYAGQSTALAIGGLLLAPFLPGVTGRQAMASRLSLELSDAMRFPNRSRESAGLAMSCFLGFSCIYYISLTGGSVTLLVWSVLPQAAKAHISWSTWLLAALPASLFVFGTTLLTILRMHRPEVNLRVTRDLVDSQLRVLGPMSRPEWVTVWVVLAIVGSFITQPLHGVDPTWVALPGFLVLATTGIVDKDLLRKGIDWGFLLLTGGLLGIAALTEKSGMVKAIATMLAPLVAPIAGHPWLFLTAVAVLTAVIHLAVPFQPTILLVALALVPVSGNLGYNPFVVGMTILIMASHFIIPHGNPMYMAAYGGSEERAFRHQQVRRLALVHAFLTLAGVWLSIPVWNWLGLLSMAPK